MSLKLVTLNQVKSVQDMANAKGVGRENFQQALDDGRVACFLDSLKVDVLTPPHEARIHTLRIRFKPDREWLEAVNAAGPNTPDHYNVRKVGGLYVPTGTDEIEEELIGINYPQSDGSWAKAQAWAKQEKHEPTVPREVFAIGEQHPNLHRELGINPMYAVETTGCAFDGDGQACCVWWDGSLRKANLNWQSDFGNGGDWFFFRKIGSKA